MNYYNQYTNPYLNLQNNMYQQPYQNNYMQNQVQQPVQQPQQQVAFMPLTFTSGLVGAKAYIVAPNQTVYLKDSDENSNLLFEKRADQYGKYTLKAFELSEINIDDIGKEKVKEPKIDIITKEDITDFATKSDLKGYFNDFNEKLNSLSEVVEKALKNKNNGNNNYGNNNNNNNNNNRG